MYNIVLVDNLDLEVDVVVNHLLNELMNSIPLQGILQWTYKNLNEAVHQKYDPTDPNQIFIGYLRERLKDEKGHKHWHGIMGIPVPTEERRGTWIVRATPSYIYKFDKIQTPQEEVEEENL